jgi:hypothetical protein
MKIVQNFVDVSLCAFAVGAVSAIVHGLTSFGCLDNEEIVCNGNSDETCSHGRLNIDETFRKHILAPNRVD